MLKQKLLKCKADGDHGKLSSVLQSWEAIAVCVAWVPIRQKTEEGEDDSSCPLRHISQDSPGCFAVSFKRFGLFGADRLSNGLRGLLSCRFSSVFFFVLFNVLRFVVTTVISRWIQA